MLEESGVLRKIGISRLREKRIAACNKVTTARHVVGARAANAQKWLPAGEKKVYAFRQDNIRMQSKLTL